MKWSKVMELKYEMVIYWSDEDKSFIVEVPELPGCMADGKTYCEAVSNAELVVHQWIDTVTEIRRTYSASNRQVDVCLMNGKNRVPRYL